MKSAEGGATHEGFHTVHQNLVAAQAMVQLENYLSSLDLDTELDRHEVDRLLESVPERMRPLFWHGVANFAQEKHNAKTCRNVMEEKINSYAEILRSRTRAEETFAHHLFREIAGTDAVGRIRCEFTEAYLFIECERPNDYARLYAAGSEDPRMVQQGKRAAACYAHVHTLKMFDDTPIGIVKYSASERQSAVVRIGIANHEKQHFINYELLALFAVMEHASDSEDMRLIKDELLAKMRNGTQRTYFTDMRTHPLYSDLYAKLDLSARQMAIGAGEALATFMEKWGYYAASGDDPLPSSRAELIYRLAPINLADWPRWLDLMDRYDEQRAARAEKKEGDTWAGMSAG